MTGRQFQESFEQSASFFNEISDIRVSSEKVNYFLNEGQRIFVNKRLDNLRNKVEGSQKNIDELRTIGVSNFQLTEIVGERTNKYNVYSLPSNYLYLLNDRSTVSHCSKEKQYPNRLSPLENLYSILNYKHTATKYNDPVSSLSGEKLYIYKNDNFTIQSCYIDYIRKYDDINVITNVSSELEENTHKDIVQLAVSIFLENVRSERFKSNIEKNIITEQIK